MVTGGDRGHAGHVEPGILFGVFIHVCCHEAGTRRPTFKLDTRSAVSRRVNWLIWSTMVEILGLALTAASVDSCIRWTKTAEEDLKELRLARSERAQLRAAILQGADMVTERCVGACLVGETKFAIGVSRSLEVVDLGGSSLVLVIARRKFLVVRADLLGLAQLHRSS
jgi:hypothetical protein